MKLRNFDLQQDYSIVEKWWKDRKWDTTVQKEMLSKHGWLVYNDNKNIAALWVHGSCNSDICWLSWPVANPESTPEERNEALNLLLDRANLFGQAMKYKFILTTTSHPKLQDRLTNNGYFLGDKNINQYIRGL